MKKLKILLWLIVIGLMGMIVFQNKDFFLAQHSLSIDLIAASYYSVELPAAVFFVGAFLSGWLFAYVLNLVERFKAAKTIRNLQSSLSVQQQAIEEMRMDVKALKPSLQPADSQAVHAEANTETAGL